ncbi:hypothetical protein ACFYUY_11285 [Kitasatospora sp. NPDC004745]|uniref:hypothetical protein n=1 Tax=Kitasatospora sp. NPDC004745 TaxID=3364019 RepID=UPI0036C71C80
MSLESWIPSRPGMCAQLNIGREEIEALGGSVESPIGDIGETEISIFGLNSGRIVALVRIAGNPASGYTLMLNEGGDPGEALREFLAESEIDSSAVTWVPDLR